MGKLSHTKRATRQRRMLLRRLLLAVKRELRDCTVKERAAASSAVADAKKRARSEKLAATLERKRKKKLLHVLRKHGRKTLPQGVEVELETGLLFASLPLSESGDVVEGPRRQSLARAEADLATLMDSTQKAGCQGLRRTLAAMEIEQFSEDLGCP